MPQLSILILSLTGAVDAALYQVLLSRCSQFTRIAAFIENTDRPTTPSKESAFTGLSNHGLEIVSGSYTTVSAFADFDNVLILLGDHGLYLQPLIIDTAIAAGVCHFYQFEWGADLSVRDNMRQRYYMDKVLTRTHLERWVQDFEGLGWTLIQVGRFTEYNVSQN